MKTTWKTLFALICAPWMCVSAHAEIKLYPTGPAQDSAFVRFVDGSGKGMRVRAADSDAVLELGNESRASSYFPVAGNSTIEGEMSHETFQEKIVVDIEPGEFVTALGVVTEQGLNVYTVHEMPDDFTAVRASVAFYNLNETCTEATVKVAGRQVNFFESVKVGDWVRRHVNPVPLSVQLECAGEVVGTVVDLGGLQAGERHSLFLLPGDPAIGFFHLKDSVTH